MMERRNVDVLCVQEPGGKAAKLEAQEQNSSCFIMVRMGRETE